MGHECYITGNHNYLSRLTRYWNPDVVFYGTLGRTLRIKEAYPNALLFYCAGEGGETYEFSDEKIFADDDKLFNSVTNIFLWGQTAKNNILRRVEEIKSKSFLYGKETLIDTKCRVYGHPRLELAKYASRNVKSTSVDEKVKVGFVGQFYLLNNAGKKHISTLLRAVGRNKNGIKLDPLVFQANLIRCYCDIMDTLGTDNYEFSLRPYPVEDIKQYLQMWRVKEGLLKIDKSIEFSTWMCEQDIIVGPMSSTLAQISYAKKTFINVDRVIGVALAKYHNNLKEIFLKATDKYTPKTMDELITMIKSVDEYKFVDTELEEIMDPYYNIKSSEGSVLLRIAIDINNCLKEVNGANPKISLPRLLVLEKIKDNILELRRKILLREKEGSYSEFNYTGMLPVLSRELDPIVETILGDSENKGLLGKK